MAIGRAGADLSDNGSVDEGSFPVNWDATNALWKAALPGKGSSTPIVWQKHIYLTAPVDGKDAVLAFDWSGQPLWRAALGTERAGKHRNGSGSNASPTTDGERLFVYFKSGSFASLNLDGKVLWHTNLVEAFGQDTLYWDHGTSPVLTEHSVVMARMHHGESWLAAFDKATGNLVWKVARNYQTPTENDHGYSTPLVIPFNGKEAVLLWGAEHLTLHDSSHGELLWSVSGFNANGERNWPAVSSPVIAQGIVVIPFGRADRGSPRLFGVKLGASNIAWKREDAGAFVPTLVEHRNRVYLVSDRGNVQCIQPASGETLWSGDLPPASTSFFSSPMVANGRIYAAREDGTVFVLQLGDRFELLAENHLGEPVIASPVAADGRLLFRGERHLFSFGVQ